MNLEFASDLAVWFRLEVSRDPEFELSVKAVVSAGSGGWRIRFRGWWPGPLVPHCMGFPIGAAWVSSQHGSWLPPKRDIQQNAKEKLKCLHIGGWTVTCHNFPRLGYASQPCSAREGALQGHKHQDVGIIGGVLGSWLPYCLRTRWERIAANFQVIAVSLGIREILYFWEMMKHLSFLRSYT